MTHGITRRRAALAVLCTSLLAGNGTALAADPWPSKAIRIIVPYAPGGIGDIVARMIQPVLQDQLKQPVIVENKPGASGSLGTEYVARSAPDGYTLLLALAAPQTLNQYIYKTGYDGVKDFAPITLINTNPMVLMVHPSLPVRTVDEFVRYAKANPGKLSFGGAGGLTSFAGEMFKHMAGIDMVHVPYRGGAPAVAATVAGDVQVTFANYSDALTWMKSGRLRAIAITSAHRTEQSPDIPTIAESGIPAYDVTGWSGLLAPAGTPPEVVERIANVLRPALQDPSMRARMANVGAESGGTSPAEFGKLVANDARKWEEFVRRTGIKINP
ncbi:tripartite tricarboxylate transporter substrate binding protein [Variovorax guangxiensis]|uniref:Bug family tripartite tricarboxylate transporter substrate binding protein n=1 Tax=Variovorax guangxiensis TaxID=1775474 RepID=UPI00285B237A|nr:tripartite tricarboxylate transporter substrate binding protein [Variovorax guangxiensis]MDR6860742.1 tripartite-type tricarboxylate transporter receptor subunit TctC [Variovorax guangxiensis]